MTRLTYLAILETLDTPLIACRFILSAAVRAANDAYCLTSVGPTDDSNDFAHGDFYPYHSSARLSTTFFALCTSHESRAKRTELSTSHPASWAMP